MRTACLLALFLAFCTTSQSQTIPGASGSATVICGGGFSMKAGRESALPLRVEPSANSCLARMARVHNLCSSRQSAAEGYDSAKQVLRECHSELGSCALFLDMDAATGWLGENERWLDLRNFLKESWGWEANGEARNADCWFCSNLIILAYTYKSYDRPNLEHEDFNGEVAIIDFVLASGRCPTDSSGLYYERKSARESQWQRWVDTVKNPHATPLDTEAVTLESLGLNYILAAAPERMAHEPDAILSFSALRNPSHHDFTLQLEADRPCAVRVEVFDVLGNSVWRSDRESIDAGLKTYDVTLPEASGTYFARVSTPSGETRTIRLIRN